MIEWLVALFTAYMLTWPALVILLILGIAFEHNGNRACAVFTGLVAMLVSYFFFNVPLQTIALATVGYLIVGVVWSFWRYKVHVEKEIASIQSMRKLDMNIKNRMLHNLSPSNNLSKITAWIIVWPFSVIENLIGDIIVSIQTLVTKVFKGVYHKIYTSRVQALLDAEEKE